MIFSRWDDLISSGLYFIANTLTLNTRKKARSLERVDK